MLMNKPKVLGKGLNALLATRATVITAPAAEPAPAESIQHVPLEKIDANPTQPRRTFKASALQDLAQSIESNGIIQPLVVRHHAGRFQLVAGERRLRAARLAGLTEVPVVIQDIPDDRLLEITLIENLQ